MGVKICTSFLLSSIPLSCNSEGQLPVTACRFYSNVATVDTMVCFKAAAVALMATSGVTLAYVNVIAAVSVSTVVVGM
jgi:hypothetical protein